MSINFERPANDNAVSPGLSQPTPTDLVARLGSGDREKRVENLMQQAAEIYRQGVDQHLDRHRLVASCVLFSGGNDSTVLAHLMRQLGVATHAAHANTTIGIEETREFVRTCCRDWGLPLLERSAPIPYRDLVMERGFPGPGMHWKMYTRLKERALDAVRAELVSNPRRERVVYIAGRRRSESLRRQTIPLHERDGSVIWVSPIAMWTKLDLNTYRLMHKDVPVNRVSELLHMSGECLCGAFARPGELDEIGFWFPSVKEDIEQLQRDVSSAGHAFPQNQWGHGRGRVSSGQGRLCTSCVAPGSSL